MRHYGAPKARLQIRRFYGGVKSWSTPRRSWAFYLYYLRKKDFVVKVHVAMPTGTKPLRGWKELCSMRGYTLIQASISARPSTHGDIITTRYQSKRGIETRQFRGVRCRPFLNPLKKLLRWPKRCLAIHIDDAFGNWEPLEVCWYRPSP